MIPTNQLLSGRTLRALANEKRILILWHLAEREKTVSELLSVLKVRQGTMSQELARLRADNLVTCRRDGKTIRYSLASDAAREVIELLDDYFCAPKIKTMKGRTARRRKAGFRNSSHKGQVP